MMIWENDFYEQGIKMARIRAMHATVQGNHKKKYYRV